MVLFNSCNVMAKGFRFMPLGLVRLRTFQLSTWVRCKLDAGVNAGARGRTKVSLRDVTIARDETGDGVRVTSRTGSAQRFVEN